MSRVVAEYSAARRRFEELVAVMSFLDREGMLPPEAARWNSFIQFEAPLPPGSPWEVALAALAENADAPLPE